MPPYSAQNSACCPGRETVVVNYAWVCAFIGDIGWQLSNSIYSSLICNLHFSIFPDFCAVPPALAHRAVISSGTPGNCRWWACPSGRPRKSRWWGLNCSLLFSECFQWWSDLCVSCPYWSENEWYSEPGKTERITHVNNSFNIRKMKKEDEEEEEEEDEKDESEERWKRLRKLKRKSRGWEEN